MLYNHPSIYNMALSRAYSAQSPSLEVFNLSNLI
jgi:hypothetical protein